jgi:predicted ATPase
MSRNRRRFVEPAQRPLFFESLARALLSVDQPLRLLLDDLQWCDQETLEWVHYLLRVNAKAPILIVGTVRTEEVAPEHQLAKLLTDLRSSERVIELDIGPFDKSETAELALHLAGRAVEPDEARELYEETEGQPLFVVEMVRARLASSDTNRPKAGASPTPANAGPLRPRVHAVIEARLDQLSDLARETVRLAATIGRDFTLDLLIEASDSDTDSLLSALDELWQRRIVREHGGADHNAPGAAAVGPAPVNVRQGVRISTAIAYLLPARARPNLTIRPGLPGRPCPAAERPRCRARDRV